MYNSQSARPAQTLSVSSQYIPPPYDFTGYHHVPGLGDPSTSAWNSVYAPREEYPFGFPGSSPSAGQVSFCSPELSGTPTSAGGGSFTPYNYISGQDPFISRRGPHESIEPSVSGGIYILDTAIEVTMMQINTVLACDKSMLRCNSRFRHLIMLRDTYRFSSLCLSELF